MASGMDFKVAQMALVIVDKEEFTVLEPPEKETRLVTKQKEQIMGSLELPVLVADLRRVGQFLRVAYNGVAGYTELQITIRGISYDFTKLCDKSSITVSHFKQAAGSVVVNLQGTYQFLLENLEDMALETLGSIEKDARDMAAASKELGNEFEQQSKRVEETIKYTLCTQKEEVNQKAAQKKQQYAYELKAAQKELEVKEREAASIKAAEEYKEVKQLQREAEQAATSTFRALTNAMFKTATFGKGGKVFDTDQDAALAETRRKEAEQLRMEMREEREKRREALSDMMKFTRLLANCNTVEELKEAVVPALDGAMLGMKKLSMLMLKISGFWKEMETQCRLLSADKVKNQIKRAMKKPKKERFKQWSSLGFKTLAIRFYGKWVAMEEVCDIYKHMISQTQHQLYAYLGEHNSTEESRRIALSLAIELKDDLVEAQDMIDKQIKEDDKKAEEND